MKKLKSNKVFLFYFFSKNGLTGFYMSHIDLKHPKKKNLISSC